MLESANTKPFRDGYRSTGFTFPIDGELVPIIIKVQQLQRCILEEDKIRDAQLAPLRQKHKSEASDLDSKLATTRFSASKS